MKVTIPYTPRKQQAFIHDQIENLDIAYSVVIEDLAKQLCALII